MNGSEHYAEAERLIEQAALDHQDPMCKWREDANLLAAAQVHATLALTAAQIDTYIIPGESMGHQATWIETTR